MKTLRTMPKWEATPEKSSEIARAKWANAPVRFTKKTLSILGHAVMEDWETPYMKVLAKIACSSAKDGVILEVGFGMGISARFIQNRPVRLHIIIEANQKVAMKAVEFGKKAKHPVCVLQGFWESACKLIPDGSVDGILFDTYPLSSRELYANHYRFFRSAHRMLRRGGTLTYYSDEENTYSADHRTRLKNSGFVKLSGEIVKITPPMDCEYWQANTIFAPCAIK